MRLDSGQFVFNATVIQQCLASAPFDPDVASRFLTYLNKTLEFQSTIAYLKSPPSDYKQVREVLRSQIVSNFVT
jgi:hypothetical protein